MRYYVLVYNKYIKPNLHIKVNVEILTIRNPVEWCISIMCLWAFGTLLYAPITLGFIWLVPTSKASILLFLFRLSHPIVTYRQRRYIRHIGSWFLKINHEVINNLRSLTKRELLLHLLSFLIHLSSLSHPLPSHLYHIKLH